MRTWSESRGWTGATLIRCQAKGPNPTSPEVVKNGDLGTAGVRVAPTTPAAQGRRNGFTYRIRIRCSFPGSSLGTVTVRMPSSNWASVFSGRIGVGNRTRRW
jgi:hypothetical protein